MKAENLNFHQTMTAERPHLAKLLELADNEQWLTKEEIFNLTGIPTGKSSGKVVPNILYAEKMGLLKFKLDKQRYSILKTKLGSQIFLTDPLLLSDQTQLILHYNLTSSNGAGLWRFVFRKYTDINKVFYESDLHSAACFQFAKSKINLTPVKNTYTKSISLGDLSFLDLNKNKWVFSSHRPLRSFTTLYGYLLLSEWEQLVPKQDELTIHDISSSIAWNKAFLWDNEVTKEVLSWITDKGIIDINNQLNPAIVMRICSSNSILSTLFSDCY